MANPRLTPSQLVVANALLDDCRARIVLAADGDANLLFALRRKIMKELGYDERSKPMARVKLKREKRAQQDGRCALCGGELPAKYSVLDRLTAIGGYTTENTRLICRPCDEATQQARGYA